MTVKFDDSTVTYSGAKWLAVLHGYKRNGLRPSNEAQESRATCKQETKEARRGENRGKTSMSGHLKRGGDTFFYTEIDNTSRQGNNFDDVFGKETHETGDTVRRNP
jgi:hypothetical protein